MTATIVYRIAKARPIGRPQDAPMRWILIRSATVATDQGTGRLLPDADAAIFTSEAEANLFAFYLKELEKEQCDTAP